MLLWPDVDEACARAKLRQRLFQLRKAPGFELLQGTEVASLAAQVQVDLAHADTDAGSGQFLTGVAEAEAGALAAGLDSALRLHCLRGDRASALAAFDRCCDVLARVLGVAPEVETEALRGHIEAMRQPASPAGRSRFR